MGVWIVEILIGVGFLILCAYYYCTSSFDYWKKKNVQGPKPSTIGGNLKDVMFGKVNYCLALKKYYDEFKTEPVVGLFDFKNNPTLLLRDPDLIRDVLIRDFNVFSDRGAFVDTNDDLSQNLSSLPYHKWRPLRNKLSPVFTSGKLREMFYLMTTCMDHFEKYLEKVVKTNEIAEFRELAAKFTTDSIGVCAFGINTNALDEESEFRKHGRDLFSVKTFNVMRRLLQQICPRLYNLLGPLKHSKGKQFIISSMKETIDYRKKNKVRRNDFVDLLMDMQAESEKEFSDLFLICQAMVFFAAGFETSSTTMGNVFYELAFNQKIQDELRKEIRTEIEKDEGKVTYDNIKKMNLLDKVFKETLRKYPPGSVMPRQASAAYTFNGTKVTIPKGMKVLIPVWAIHRDPEIWPDPEKFDPERFNEENDKTWHPMNYLPFGDGPHNCIGSRFANYQTKLGIIAVINKFKVDVCEKTRVPYEIVARSIVPAPVGGVHLKLSKVN